MVTFILAGLFGAVVGSFLNVCIYRLPEEKSIVSPGSRCRNCGRPVRPYDNIPVVSYLILGGKCRDCGAHISYRYMLVEILTALFSVLLCWKFGPDLKYFCAFAFVSSLVVITFIDLDHQIIPDVITLPGIPISVIAAVFIMGLTWKDCLIGVLIGGGTLYLVAFFYKLFTGREGMGFGDIKLMAMLGAFLGWKSLIFILLVSSLLGSVVGISLMAFRGANWKYAVPFGPFLSVAAVAYIFLGKSIPGLIIW